MYQEHQEITRRIREVPGKLANLQKKQREESKENQESTGNQYTGKLLVSSYYIIAFYQVGYPCTNSLAWLSYTMQLGSKSVLTDKATEIFKYRQYFYLFKSCNQHFKNFYNFITQHILQASYRGVRAVAAQGIQVFCHKTFFLPH